MRRMSRAPKAMLLLTGSALLLGATGCATGDDTTATCVVQKPDGTAVVVDERHCDDGGDGMVFISSGGSHYRSGQRIPKGAKLLSGRAARAAGQAPGNFGKQGGFGRGVSGAHGSGHGGSGHGGSGGG